MKHEKRDRLYRMWVVVIILAMSTAVVTQAIPRSMAAPAGSEHTYAAYDIKPPPLSALIAKVKPAVVSIAVEKNTHSRPSMNEMPEFRGPNQEWLFRFFGMPNTPEPRSYKSHVQGSGFIVDDSGIIVTNNHVVEGANEIVVILDSGDRLSASLVGSDKKTDLAVLKVETNSPLPYVQFGDSDDAAVGDWVIAIGNPFGFGGTATAGIISARGRDLQSGPYVDFIQIDAPINSGNSGGPVFDANGDVIGVNTAIYSPNGGNVGLGFAIPSIDVQLIVGELIDNGSIERGWLGVQIQDLDDALVDSLGLDSDIGALIADVLPGSPAAAAGADVGDVIVKFDDVDVVNAKTLTRLVSGAETGGTVMMLIIRDGKRKVLKPQIAILDNQPTVASVPSGGSDLGLRVAPLTSGERNQLGIEPSIDGVIVVAVEPSKQAARGGIHRGDIISRVNSNLVHTPNEFRDAVARLREKDRHQVALLIHRGSNRRFITLTLG